LTKQRAGFGFSIRRAVVCRIAPQDFLLSVAYEVDSTKKEFEFGKEFSLVNEFSTSESKKIKLWMRLSVHKRIIMLGFRTFT
jgi:hypothetical protein